MSLSKTRTSFYRRLYVAYLIDAGLATSVPALVAATGMPRRTAQDTLAALGELDIRCEFEQTPGARHLSGRYVIHDWGPLSAEWIATHAAALAQTLGYPPPPTTPAE
ncbi:helix-turn-helix domain-containing protein [Salinicola sp. DM10]|uniref:winged helix-turn-helix domain-containing protein n=1 Tax=Salinicola sp. DM10 TaxID=2815721 RepID=UPI001A90218E|nr:winged helix-turn-helix domain-containing protein [Salinicola sp. DM10]MCE3026071.1 winged helix-turn-helix domain-containing protein [Salinicola sp. DM10]